MVMRYIEGFDSLQTTTDVQEDGWRSSRTDGQVLSSQFAFVGGRLNARAFGNNRFISGDGLGRAVPTGMTRELHIGFSKRYVPFNDSGVQNVSNLITLFDQRGTTLVPVFVLTYQDQARVFHFTVNERAGTSSTPTQRTVSFAAPMWFDFSQWNYFEVISRNEGREFYAFVNGEALGAFINAEIQWESPQFAFFYFGIFPTIAQWNFPVNTTGVGNRDIDNDSNAWFADDIFVRDAIGSTPLGDYRMNDGQPVEDFSVEFTPTVGSPNNFSQIDDISPDGDLSVVSSDAPTKTDLYAHNAVTSAVVLPETLSLKTRITAKNGVAAPVNLTGIISDGLITREGGQYPISSQYANYSLIYNTSPTDTQWTKTSIETVYAGFTHKVA